VKRWLKQYVKQFSTVKRLRGRYRARQTRTFAAWWRSLIEGGGTLWHDTRRKDHPPSVLLATSVGAHQDGTRLDSVLAAALHLRGADVHVWLCDQALPACQLADVYLYADQRSFLRNGPQRDLCKTCFAPAGSLFQSMGLPVHRYSDYLTPEERKSTGELAARIPVSEIPLYRLGGVAVGEHALAGALRFFTRGSLDGEPLGEQVLRAYFRAALLSAYAIRRLIEQVGFDCVIMHHGVYVPQGVINEVCRKQGVRVVTWHPAYRQSCFTFSEGDTYHRTLISEPTSNWEQMPWTAQTEAALMDYLKSRRYGSRDWIVFNRRPQEDLRAIAATLGLDPAKPWIGMLTNVMWDARLHYPANAFPDMREWVMRTIEYFTRRPELQLVIRAHPAEVTGLSPARQRIAEEIAQAFPVLPPNVVVIPPESRISTYSVMLHCDTVLTYATKMGIELAAFGMPVIVAGEAWIRNKGFSLDVTSPEDYLRLLDRLPQGRRMDRAATERARKYAFHYFFRRMIPLAFIRREPGILLRFTVTLGGLGDLLLGRSRGLDVICDGILRGTEFIYPAEAEEVRKAEPHADLT
jgi:hypothetical protein